MSDTASNDTSSSTNENAEIVAAINAQRLATWATGDRHVEAAATCARIGAEVDAEVAELADWLSDLDVDLTFDSTTGPRQRHTVSATTTSYESAERAANVLGERGFERWTNWTRGAEESFRRTANEMTVARTGAVSFVIRIRWGDVGTPRRLDRLTRPTAGDWSMVDLPRRLWWGYSLVRPVRQFLERTGRRDPHESGLGPFLLTPRSLFEPLFDVVSLGPDDVLLDIGCGDGQLVQAAAESAGCQAIGIEHDRDLVDRGTRRIAGSSASDHIELRHGDAREADLSAVTVAFVFLPMPVVGRILEPTLAQLAPGARLIVHEQTSLPTSIPVAPDSSTAVIADNAVTVAHLWHA